MSKSVKIIIAALGAILLLTVAAYVAVSSYLTPDRVRRTAQQIASQTLDHPVNIGGARLSFGFRIAISVSDISIPDIEAADQEPMLRIGEARLNIDLFPLLRGKIEIGSIDLVRVDVSAKRDADKNLNIAVLVPKQMKGPEFVISLSQLRIRSGNFSYYDALSRSEYQIRDINQEITFKRSLVSIKGDLRVSVPGNGNRILAKQEITVSNAIDYDTGSRDITIRNVKASVDPVLASLSGSVKKSEALDIKGEVTVSDMSRLANRLPEAYRMEKMGGTLRSSLSVLGTVSKPEITGTCRLEGVTVMPKGMNRAIERTSGDFSFSTRSINNIDLRGNFGKTTFNIKGAVTQLDTREPLLDVQAGVDGNLKDLESLTEAMKGITMSGNITGSVSVKGTTKKPRYSGSVGIQGALIDGIGLEKPITNLNIKSRLLDDVVRVDECRGQIGRSDFAFTGSVSDFKKPVIRLNNNSNLIDLDELLPTNGGSRDAAAKPLPVTLQGSVKINRLTGLNMEFTGISTDFNYVNGIVDVRNCRAQAFDGQVSLDFYYDSKKPEPYRINARMSSVQAQKVGQRFIGFDRMTGNLSGGVDFRGNGLDKRSVQANMNGTGSVKVVNGEFKNFVFLGKLLDWMGMGDRKTVTFSDFNSGFTIANGRASMDDWTLSSQAGDFLSRGSIGLNGAVDMQISITLSRSNSDIVKRYHGDWIFFTDKDGRTVIDVIARGKFDSPTFTLDRNRIKERISGRIKTEFEKKTKEFESKLKDVIKGLK
ncbi:AsmA family protein [candidate division WOR-3 bacterium]|nr:AsmA family protein [candidate division WOR-3 bacterium]